MSATVRIPTPLQRFTNNQAEVSAQGGTIAAVLQDLEQQFPGMKERLCDDSGQLRRFVNVYVNGEDIRYQENQETPVPEGAEVSIIPAIAGGLPQSAERKGHGAEGIAPGPFALERTE